MASVGDLMADAIVHARYAEIPPWRSRDILTSHRASRSRARSGTASLLCYYELMSHRLQVLIPEPLDAAIRKAAQRRRLSKGAWVRGAIERALSDERSGDDPLARLSSLGAPTADPEQMLEEIEVGRSR